MRLIFEASGPLGEYHGNGLHFKPGDVCDVPDGEGEGLLRDFPRNFAVAQDKAFDAPPADKMMRRGRPAKVK